MKARVGRFESELVIDRVGILNGVRSWPKDRDQSPSKARYLGLDRVLQPFPATSQSTVTSEKSS